MSDTPPDQKEPKKGSSGNFLLAVLAVFLIVSMIQNFRNTKVANVSFSYQLEHLVNLQLIDPEHSRKTALKENLVTFSGKFRENISDEGKARYKYLGLLDSDYELVAENGEILGRLDELRERITETGDLFLHLAGESIPPEGYVIVSEAYDVPDRENHIILYRLSDRAVSGFEAFTNRLRRAQFDTSQQSVREVGRQLSDLLHQFQSPTFGIGDEQLKQELRALDRMVTEASLPTVEGGKALAVFQDAFGKLKAVAAKLNSEASGIRLGELRVVRDYREAMEQYQANLVAIEDSQAKLNKARETAMNVIWFFSNKEISTRTLETQDREAFKHWFLNAKREWEAFEKNKGAIFKAPDQPTNIVLEKTFRSQALAPNYFSYFITALPVLILLGLLYFAFSRQMKGMGGGAMNFGKSPAKMMQAGEGKVTFKDVAGADEAKDELYEVVDFLKNPQKFTSLGGRIPKGVLCVGPPGTGKTLIAKAVAGEADRPFFSISGSDFVEMFVGVGASRIRDMFEQAKKSAPCIVFIDEIDAVGRHRGSGIGGGHDEREQTLNQLLVEMDGFDTNEGVILIAATNRPDVLDKALLRPGRFDRRVILDLPDIKGRFDILKVHARKVKLDTSVDLMSLAKGTPGSSGADLANILNEAALLAARKDRTAVTDAEVVEARDKVLYGKERRSLEVGEQEKKTTAYHESGHAVVGLLVEHSDTVNKVTIIPRGHSLGATHFLPEKNRLSYWKKEMLDQLAVLMGGRCAEEIFLKDCSSGAQQDIQQATELARNMVCRWGMSDVLGTVAYEEHSSSGQYLGMPGQSDKSYSEDTAQAIDAEIRRIVEEGYKYAMKLLKKNRKQVQLMTDMLMEFETLDLEDCRKIVVDKNWDVKAKRRKLKRLEKLHKKEPTLPSSKDEKGEDDVSQPSLDDAQPEAT